MCRHPHEQAPHEQAPHGQAPHGQAPQGQAPQGQASHHKQDVAVLPNRTYVFVSRKSATIFGQGTIPEPSTPHIGKGVATVATVAQAAAFVYIYSPESPR